MGNTVSSATPKAPAATETPKPASSNSKATPAAPAAAAPASPTAVVTAGPANATAQAGGFWGLSIARKSVVRSSSSIKKAAKKGTKKAAVAATKKPAAKKGEKKLVPLKDRLVTELIKQAKLLNIKGTSQMNKNELISKIKARSGR